MVLKIEKNSKLIVVYQALAREESIEEKWARWQV